MEDYIINVSCGGIDRIIKAGGEQSIFKTLRDFNLAPDAPCGGNGKCGKCNIIIDGVCRYENGREMALNHESVPSCKVYPKGNLKIIIPNNGKVMALTMDTVIPAGGEGLALAVDIGTTTLAVYLYDLSSGKCLKSKGEYNAQGAYGADVIRRIEFAGVDKGLEILSNTAREQILKIAKELSGDRFKEINYISIAGNTVMEHLFAAISPNSIGVAPYEPKELFGKEYPAESFFDGLNNKCTVYIAPAVAGFVGGDITAGLLSCGAGDDDEIVLFIDIGTNGEIVLGNSNGFVCCSAAAGPAFEGGEIECGSPARTGAIFRVYDDMSYDVIGGGTAESICGSGLIDCAAAMLKSGFLSDTGRLIDGRYNFNGNLYVSPKDIRQLQLAKAAVRAGIDTAVEIYGCTYDNIDKVLIAGGFGAAMNTDSACAIGLLPLALSNKISYVGNASGLGAAMAINANMRSKLKSIQEKCRYEELTVSDIFSEKYINAMLFGEPDED